HVVASEHGNDTRDSPCRGCIDPADAGVRMRRAHENAVQGAGGGDVGNEASPAKQEGAILDAGQRGPDAAGVRDYCSSSRTRSSRSKADLSVTMNRSASPAFAWWRAQVQCGMVKTSCSDQSKVWSAMCERPSPRTTRHTTLKVARFMRVQAPALRRAA